MLTLLSPAKTLDFETPAITEKTSQPAFLEQSADLVDVLKQFSPDELGKLMKLSPKLSQLNIERFQQWTLPFTKENAKAAVLAFKGDVYTGLDAESLTEENLEFAQQHVRILSGLYGLLKPLDLIQAYRLEMGTKLENPKGKNLYQYWGDTLTQAVNHEVEESGSNIIINLASNEYFSAINTKLLKAELVTPVFKDEKNGQYKIISFYAKKARGLMTRWILENKLNSSDKLVDFDVAGYRFSEEDSKKNNPVFKRAEKDSVNA